MFSKGRRRLVVGAAVAAMFTLTGLSLLAAPGDSTAGRVAADHARSAGAGPAGFSWLRPAAAPAGWKRATIASGSATLFYPARWRSIPGDSGTVTASLLDRRGIYHGYLNVTPRQGDERLNGWAGFRTRRNRDEGDRRVNELAAGVGLRFRAARGSCVIDDYISRVGSHPYREVACIVAGRRGTDVLVGATLKRDWPILGPTVERAASSFIER